ncbi:hypothetical protein ACO2Q1_05230 [Brevundimonas sp. VNH65]|uniref:hypothetical protein n=1 Tax=Brevundimonas sp. VNH65 TaxID=3400917 RepID=UPI003C042E5F
MDSQAPVPDARLVIGDNRVGYAVLAGFSLSGAFVSSAVFGAGGGVFSLLLLGVAVVYGLFNVGGMLRPKRLLLSPEGMLYRPVVGRGRFVRWKDVRRVDYSVIDYAAGILTYRDEGGRLRRLGFWLDVAAVAREVERWRAIGA